VSISEFAILSPIEIAVLRLIRRKPALAQVILQMGELVIGRRNCRMQVEVVDGILRRYDLTPALRVELETQKDLEC